MNPADELPEGSTWALQLDADDLEHGGDDKYIVFKREDFERHIFGDAAPPYTRYALDDAVVIRTQDMFAGPALHAYAANIALVSSVTGNTALRRSADYMHRRALEADERNAVGDSKFPD